MGNFKLMLKDFSLIRTQLCLNAVEILDCRLDLRSFAEFGGVSETTNCPHHGGCSSLRK